jgi:SMI1 / KNR4 family (SUKH-1)
MRWQPLLAEIRAKKLTIARLDPRAGMPVMPPAGAAPSAVAAVEHRLGRHLPPSYRELLSQHDGLPGFYQGASLLGARPLSRGTYVELARLYLDAERGASVVPFGIDATGDVIFAWDTTVAHAGDELEVVVWMNEIGVRVPSFPAFLELVLDMLGAEIAERLRLLGRNGRGPADAAEPAPRAPRPSWSGVAASLATHARGFEAA